MPAATAIPPPLRLLQALDRGAGGWLLRHVRPRATALTEDARGAPLPPDAVRRVLVIRPGGLGDAILLVPALRALRRALPSSATPRRWRTRSRPSRCAATTTVPSRC
jgi:hypothetical protein